MTWDSGHRGEEVCKPHHNSKTEEGVAKIDTAGGDDLRQSSRNQTLLSSDLVICESTEEESKHSSSKTYTV